MFKRLFRACYDYTAADDFNELPTFPTFADGHYEIRLCEAVLESQRRQRWANIAEQLTMDN